MRDSPLTDVLNYMKSKELLSRNMYTIHAKRDRIRLILTFAAAVGLVFVWLSLAGFIDSNRSGAGLIPIDLQANRKAAAASRGLRELTETEPESEINREEMPSVHASSHQGIQVVERHCLDFNIDGYMFDENGRYRRLEHASTSCLVHSFSPQVEHEAARRFLDPARDNVYFANSPAILWHKEQLVLVSRIWLDREKYEDRNDWPSNQFADNWLYMQKFDARMRPVSNGTILGIPSPKQWWVGDGPIEPRLFHCQDRLFVTFNSAMAFAQKYFMDFTIMWDLDQNLPVIPKIEGGTPMVNATEKDDMPRDKHWMSLVDRDQLYFVHNLDPLRILKCSLEGQCKFVHRELGHNGFIFSDAHSHLRGGTPFEEYRWPYYVSVAHTTMYKKTNHHRFYSAHLVVISVDPYHVVYISEPIKINPKLYLLAPMVRKRYIDEGFMFPVGLILEDEDYMDIGAHVNDHSSVIIRVKGLKSLMDDVIANDKARNPRHGPPSGYLQQHIHDILVNHTHVGLIHEVV